MHDAIIGAVCMFLGEDAGHVLVGVAGMDDQRQAGFARGGDMDAQAVLLHRLAVGGVVIIQPGFADADEFGMRGQADQFIDAGQGFVGGAHRMRAGGVEDRIILLGQGAHLRFESQLGADRDHAGHTGLERARDHLVAVLVEGIEIEMAVAVGDLDGVAHVAPDAGGSTRRSLLNPEHGI